MDSQSYFYGSQLLSHHTHNITSTVTHSLGFDEKPNYQYLHSILLQCSESQMETEQSDSSSCSAVSLDSVRNQM